MVASHSFVHSHNFVNSRLSRYSWARAGFLRHLSDLSRKFTSDKKPRLEKNEKKTGKLNETMQ